MNVLSPLYLKIISNWQTNGSSLSFCIIKTSLFQRFAINRLSVDPNFQFEHHKINKTNRLAFGLQMFRSLWKFMESFRAFPSSCDLPVKFATQHFIKIRGGKSLTMEVKAKNS